MVNNFYTEFLTLICFLLFFVTSFVNININEFLNKFVYLSSLFLVSIVNLVYYNYISSLNSSYLGQVTTLLLSILLFSYFIVCFFYFEFIRLRLIFIPFFIILIMFRYLTFLGSESNNVALDLFRNKYLLFHIFCSLFAYSMLTICAICSFSVFIKSHFIKKIKFNSVLINLLPSMYQSEILTTRFLYLTIFFLFSSILTGLIFHISKYQDFFFFLIIKSL